MDGNINILQQFVKQGTEVKCSVLKMHFNIEH